MISKIEAAPIVIADRTEESATALTKYIEAATDIQNPRVVLSSRELTTVLTKDLPMQLLVIRLPFGYENPQPILGMLRRYVSMRKEPLKIIAVNAEKPRGKVAKEFNKLGIVSLSYPTNLDQFIDTVKSLFSHS